LDNHIHWVHQKQMTPEVSMKLKFSVKYTFIICNFQLNKPREMWPEVAATQLIALHDLLDEKVCAGPKLLALNLIYLLCRRRKQRVVSSIGATCA
jgi:hypothetical protein